MSAATAHDLLLPQPPGGLLPAAVLAGRDAATEADLWPLFYVLPIDEATVYNEMLELLYLEKTELKKLDTAGKTDAIVAKALAYKDSFPKITFEEGVKLMGPVRNPYENRPV